MKNEYQVPLILYESNLQGYCEQYLHDNKVEFFRIPDRFWHWIYKNCTVGIRCWLYRIFGSLPDMMIFLPIDNRFMLAVNMELKRLGRGLRDSQKEAASRLPWVTVKSPEDVDRVVSDARDFVERIKLL